MLLKIPITQSTMTSNKARYSATRRRAIQHGYRSGFEEATSKQIIDAGLPLLFETDKIEFVWPSRNAKYTPDFKLPKPGGFYYVETKGFWGVSDRSKACLLYKQHPDMDLRYVFQNWNTKIYKGSPTTYKMFAEKQGFTLANKEIPQEWIDESLSALL